VVVVTMTIGAVTPNVRAKAKRLFAEGRVTARNIEEFDVVGDTGTYDVWLPGGKLNLRGSCTCKRAKYGDPCSHIEAVKLFIAARNGGEI
jgi:hypothetical protein